jgi:hypothetical protein
MGVKFRHRCLLLSGGLVLGACTQGIDTVWEGSSQATHPSTGGGSSTGGAGGKVSSGASGVSSGTGETGGAAGDMATGTGGDSVAGASGDGGGTGGQMMPPEAGVDARPDPPATTAPPGAYWKLDEASGTVAADSSGNGHALAVVGGTWVTGKVGAHAASFNGTSAYAETNGIAVIDTSKPYTAAAWVQLSTVAGFRTAVSIDGAAVSAFFLQLRGDSGVRFGFSVLSADTPGAATFALGKAAPTANTWYHIAGVFDGANIKLYVNGALEDNKPFASAWTGTGSTAVGRGFYSGARADFWPGLVDEVHIFARALSDAEIAALATP